MSSQEEKKKKEKIIEDNFKATIEKINIKDYHIGAKIGKYSYGSLYFCKKIINNSFYVLKIYKKGKILQENATANVYNEYLNLSQIYHPFINELKGINYTDSVNLYFLYDYIPGEEIKYYIKKNKSLQLRSARFYCACLITIFDYLHKKNIIYRGLRPENILINETGYIKLVDFIFSKKLKSEYTYSIVGLHEYHSPEMINKEGYNKSIDFWQIGILLYEMLTGYTPFFDTDPYQLYNNIKKGKVKYPNNFDRNTKLIINHFLNVDKNKRLGCRKRGIYDIIDEPFFEGFDWEKLLKRNLEPPFFPEINRDKHKMMDNSNNNDDNDEEDIEIPRDKDIFYNW
jgi:serine/threonine protein kinase